MPSKTVKQMIIGGLVMLGLLGLLFLLVRWSGQALFGGLTAETITVNLPASEITATATPAGWRGIRAPAFDLPLAGDGQKTLASYLGEPLVIVFWTTWNEAAVNQLKILDDYLAATPEPLIRVITVDSQEPPALVEAFLRRGGYQLPVLLDETGAVTSLYQARLLPAIYLLDRRGFIRDRLLGATGAAALVDRALPLIKELGL